MECEPAEGLPPISGDRDKIRQCLVNLMSNAVKFTPDGGRVAVRSRLEEGGRVAVEVCDTGIGILPEHLVRIFEVFYQVDGSNTREYGGAGLGLAIVKSFVEAHGGEVKVASDARPGLHLHAPLPGARRPRGLPAQGAGRLECRSATVPPLPGRERERAVSVDPRPSSSSSDSSPVRAPLSGAGVALGVGDDAAVLRPPPGEELVVTVDAVVEGVHFDRRFTPFDVGWKSLAVNLSDLAAMGARPLWALVRPGHAARRRAAPAGGGARPGRLRPRPRRRAGGRQRHRAPGSSHSP